MADETKNPRGAALTTRYSNNGQGDYEEDPQGKFVMDEGGAFRDYEVPKEEKPEKESAKK